jgi:hypothetical protein
MNYSYNTGFYDFKGGSIQVCPYGYTHNPNISIWAHANGEYDYGFYSG